MACARKHEGGFWCKGGAKMLRDGRRSGLKRRAWADPESPAALSGEGLLPPVGVSGHGSCLEAGVMHQPSRSPA
ncbi:hypothetical protein DVU_2821 [Nitratidesulfovibrio vulgaris str. Hildenborough]|uniref:Uncharacterized protein n=1 Tax=Nitratidesulfovibrio vulgaris (strain ATCC 29579 / DSM 644 / CCUG 34227 / NCIMB 8303 / VKM B-1760 / Hildenborough) TaxID=882 RepID=Q727N4_NITV2|nr:hypothetical protein DVU_2821 [Nitratidesulfovibrio vulgaris str. Hildenborough]